jgi:hypothetical protein
MERPLLIESVRPEQLRPFTSRLVGYAKSCSIVWLKALGIPTLDGLVVDSWTTLTQKCIVDFARGIRGNVLLLRIDRKNERWTDRRGGYLVNVKEIAGLWVDLSSEGFIPILLEPASPYSNQCALTGLILMPEEKLVIEAVGRGFDASDILRSDLAPHERWEVFMSGEPGLQHFRAAPQRTFVISGDKYYATWQKRLTKIGARLSNPAFPQKIPSDVSEVRLRNEAAAFLQSTDQHGLLESTVYSPLPLSTVQQFADYLLKLKNGLNQRMLTIGSISAAASVISDGRMVFWDFFPANPQEIPLLWT